MVNSSPHFHGNPGLRLRDGNLGFAGLELRLEGCLGEILHRQLCAVGLVASDTVVLEPEPVAAR